MLGDFCLIILFFAYLFCEGKPLLGPQPWMQNPRWGCRFFRSPHDSVENESTCFIAITSHPRTLVVEESIVQIDTFCADLQLSALCNPSVYMVGEMDYAEFLDKLVQLYNKTLMALLNVHAPVANQTIHTWPITDIVGWRRDMPGGWNAGISARFWLLSRSIITSSLTTSGHPFGNLKSVLQQTFDRLRSQG